MPYKVKKMQSEMCNKQQTYPISFFFWDKSDSAKISTAGCVGFGLFCFIKNNICEVLLGLMAWAVKTIPELC